MSKQVVTAVSAITAMEKSLALQAIVFKLVIVAFIVFISVLAYWTLEEDPLTVTRVDGDATWSLCHGRTFEFRREVKSSKDITIYVQERWHDLDGWMNENGVEGELVIPRPLHYPLGEDFDKVMTFKKQLPKTLPIGRYEYRPWATYQVNPIKKITRLLPMQRVEVTCEYDPVKHGVME